VQVPSSTRAVHRRRRMFAVLASLALVAFVAGAVAGAGGSAPADPSDASERRDAIAALELAGLRPRPPTRAERERAREHAAIRKVLGFTSFISRGSPRKREVALTFDDGPGPYTEQVLTVLRRERVPATFFVIGEEVKDFGGALAAEVREGFVIGNHTQTHPMLADLSPAGQRRQIEDQDIIVGAAGVPPERLFRPPYGSYDAATLALLKRKGMLMVLWDVDTEDYTQPGVDAIVAAAVGQARPGSIVLMHDAGGDRSQTVAALPAIIRGLRAKGLRPVSVPQLIVDDPPPANQGPPPNLAGG
jgi:peptidoglycan-N-acetylglucosamine deacetylase